MYLDQRPPRISSIPTLKTTRNTIHLQCVTPIGHRLSCPHSPFPATIPLPPIRLSRPSRQKGHVIKQKKSPAVTHSTRLGTADFAKAGRASVRCSGRVAEQYLLTTTCTSSTCALSRPQPCLNPSHQHDRSPHKHSEADEENKHILFNASLTWIHLINTRQNPKQPLGGRRRRAARNLQEAHPV